MGHALQAAPARGLHLLAGGAAPLAGGLRTLRGRAVRGGSTGRQGRAALAQPPRRPAVTRARHAGCIALQRPCRPFAAAQPPTACCDPLPPRRRARRGCRCGWSVARCACPPALGCRCCWWGPAPGWHPSAPFCSIARQRCWRVSARRLWTPRSRVARRPGCCQREHAAVPAQSQLELLNLSPGCVAPLPSRFDFPAGEGPRPAPCTLFFGCRNEAGDFYFRAEVGAKRPHEHAPIWCPLRCLLCCPARPCCVLLPVWRAGEGRCS